MSIKDTSDTGTPCAGNLKWQGMEAFHSRKDPKTPKTFSLDPQASRLYTPRKPRYFHVTSGGHVYEAEVEAV
jgi:hypothetical protein